ncbi:hypothetical protein [Clostridium sp. CF012]|uniref:hypothetical protein n=1 Tax=Clostridium sp. CF012 TaxID=2843319 RepID=UPI001C0E2CBB|nr:hypothetical protein [Clostridium sp. CF012]MBU3144448.1 hypothetical protein [Clostridium sp. CF012]
MKISKNIFISALIVIVTLSIIMVTLLFAHLYTSDHSVNNNSSQKGNGRMPQGEFQKKDSITPEGTPPNGDFKKPEN